MVNEVRMGDEERGLFWYLKKVDLFQDLSDTELESLGEVLRFREYKRGESIDVSQNAYRRIYFLMRGKVKLCHVTREGREFIVIILGAGEMFGLLSTLAEEDWNPLVVALEDCLVAYLEAKEFQQLLVERPQLCLASHQYLGKRLLKIENRLAELVFLSIPVRLARLLVRLSKEYPRPRSCGVQIDLRLTQQDYADLIGATRESTSHALNRFRRKGWLDIHQRYVCVHDRDALEGLFK